LKFGAGGFVIFGFNTDVKHDETVYHVQSEARQNELLLLTEIFVKGRCVGKRAASYAEHTIQPDFSDQHIHEMLKEQHKYFVAAVREGRIDAEFPEAAASQPAIATIEDAAAEASTPELEIAPFEDLAAFASAFDETPAPPPEQPEFTLSAISGVIGKGLTLDCLPPLCAAGGNTVIVCVQVSDDSGPVSGAQVTCRITSGKGPASYVYSASGDTGIAEVDVELQELDLATAALLIQASEGRRSVSRKFQLRRA
jgi:hypothetical protein